MAAVAEREATEEKLGQHMDFDAIAVELDSKSPLEIMDHVSGLREAAPGMSCIWCCTVLLLMLERRGSFAHSPGTDPATAPSFEAFWACTARRSRPLAMRLALPSAGRRTLLWWSMPTSLAGPSGFSGGPVPWLS